MVSVVSFCSGGRPLGLRFGVFQDGVVDGWYWGVGVDRFGYRGSNS